jgi:hypothetical protein
MPDQIFYNWLPLLYTLLLVIAIVASLILLIISLFGRGRSDAPARLALAVYCLLLGGTLLTATYLIFGGTGLTSNDLATFPELWGVGAILLGLLLLAGGLIARWKSASTDVGHPFLFAVAGIALTILLLVVRGPDDWKVIPLGEDVVGFAIVIGIIVYALSRRATRIRVA